MGIFERVAHRILFLEQPPEWAYDDPEEVSHLEEALRTLPKSIAQRADKDYLSSESPLNYEFDRTAFENLLSQRMEGLVNRNAWYSALFPGSVFLISTLTDAAQGNEFSLNGFFGRVSGALISYSIICAYSTRKDQLRRLEDFYENYMPFILIHKGLERQAENKNFTFSERNGVIYEGSIQLSDISRDFLVKYDAVRQELTFGQKRIRFPNYGEKEGSLEYKNSRIHSEEAIRHVVSEAPLKYRGVLAKIAADLIAAVEANQPFRGDSQGSLPSSNRYLQ